MPLDVNIIIPFYFQQSGRGDLDSAKKRLDYCLLSLDNKPNITILLSTNQIQSLTGKLRCQLINDMQSLPVYSPGVARNHAINFSTTSSIFLMDADLRCPTTLIEHITLRNNSLCKAIPNAFEMYPCLYLTKEETERFDGDFQGCLESFLRGENHRVEGIALASSCLLLNREWFLQLGGFDERFVGHGGEDLELIDRLCQHYPIGPRPADYGLNIKAQHPGDYQGFRRYFSYYALPHLFAGRFLVHQWHPRPLTHPYHKRRAGNDALLEQMLAQPGPLKGPVIPCNDLNGELPDFREWMIRLQEEAGYPVSEYPGLLRWKEGVTVKRPLWRKMRKLYLNPKAFFRDMLKSKF
ncbi:galactosyltransferase-related protein [Leclercia adecarboxylata]|uniref:galactosyltransferase-related protein n=1 Tax=Leclercia adecarboxylata TaxID=83655 RepID=UPI002DB86864|nr:galactosyltransferase-related protein [Leclercia adecarboxylata]MEB6379758.1 galactosyltransferase-related protein [Leclercia adecarboxylata]